MANAAAISYTRDDHDTDGRHSEIEWQETAEDQEKNEMTGAVLIKTAVAVGAVGDGVFAVMAVVDPSITNIIGVVVGAIVTITMGVIAYKTVSLNKKIDAQAEKVDQTLRKTDVVLGHVNSEKAEDQGKIKTLEKENLLLREMVTDKKTTAALLAQAAATAPPVPATSAPDA